MLQAHLEMYGGALVYLPLVLRADRKMVEGTGRWPGIEFLPDDIQIGGEISITH